MPFARGDDFPGAAHSARYDNYTRWRQILRGDHAAAWTASKALLSLAGDDYGRDKRVKAMVERLDAELSVVVNLPRVIERKFASLMIRGLALTVPGDDERAQDALDGALLASGGAPIFHRCAFRMCGYGNAVLTVSRGADGVVRFNPRDPWTWFPDVDKADGARATRHTFAWRQTFGGREYLLQEIHEPGKITRLANAITGSRGSEKLGQDTTWQALGFDPLIFKPEEATGIDEPLVSVWSNVTDEETVYGDSDLLGNEPMAHEVTSRISQVSSILDKHADPKMQGPERATRTDQSTGEARVDISGSRFLPRRGADEAPFEYLTWNAQLEQAYEHLSNAVKLLCLDMEMAPALLGLEEGAGVESSQALRIRAVNTVDAVESKRMFCSPGITQAGRLALLLSGIKNVQPTVRFGDVLPLTRQELVESVTIERTAGLLSRARALLRLNPEMPQEEVDAEIERIRVEEAGIMNPGMA